MMMIIRLVWGTSQQYGTDSIEVYSSSTYFRRSDSVWKDDNDQREEDVAVEGMMPCSVDSWKSMSVVEMATS